MSSLLACESAELERPTTDRASAAIASDRVRLACEVGAARVDVAVSDGQALAVWTQGTSVHATRFSSTGAVLDVPAIDLGAPPAPATVQTTWKPESLRVAPFIDGSFVVVAAYWGSAWPPVQEEAVVAYRFVDSSGLLCSPWLTLAMPSAGGYERAQAMVIDVDYDGTRAFVVFSVGRQWGIDPGKIDYPLLVRSIDTVGSAFVYSLPHSFPSLSPAYHGFGCGAGECLLVARKAGTDYAPWSFLIDGGIQETWLEPQVGLGDIVATPAGYLHVSSAGYGVDSVRRTGFTSAGAIAVPVADVWTGLPLLSRTTLAFDDVEARVLWRGHADDDLNTATLTPDGNPSSAPTVEDAEFVGGVEVRAASFGAGRTVVGFAAADGPSIQFVGATPALAPPLDCSGGGGGAGGGGGGGGAGSSTTSSSSGSGCEEFATVSSSTSSSSGSGGEGGGTVSSSTSSSSGSGGEGGGAGSSSTSSSGGSGGEGGGTASSSTSSSGGSGGDGGSSVSSGASSTPAGAGGSTTAGSVTTTGSDAQPPEEAGGDGCSTAPGGTSQSRSTGWLLLAVAFVLSAVRRLGTS